MDLKEIKAQALKEIKEDQFKAAVEKEKQRLLTKKSFWDKVWPWKIIILRK